MMIESGNTVCMTWSLLSIVCRVLRAGEPFQGSTLTYEITLFRNVRMPMMRKNRKNALSPSHVQPIGSAGKACPLVGGTITERNPSATYVTGLQSVMIWNTLIALIDVQV